MANPSVSYQEHYVLLEFYQKKLKEKNVANTILKNKIEELSAKIEILNQNKILT